DVGVQLVSVCSLYAKATAGFAGEASVEFATSGTIPSTTVPAAGFEKVSEGGVLSTRVVIRVDVVEFPATSVAITCRSYRPSITPVVSHRAVWLENAPLCGAIS